MRTHLRGTFRSQRQAGFTMVEMLMTAFIMAVGILGLTMLQMMSLKGSRGGRSLSSAVLVADNVMDRVEMQGRLSWLNKTNSLALTPTLGDFNAADLKYVALAGPFNDYFDVNGNGVAAPPAFYTVTTTKVNFAPAATGGLSDFTVQVRFSDQVDQAKAPILRTVTLTRRVIHG